MKKFFYIFIIIFSARLFSHQENIPAYQVIETSGHQFHVLEVDPKSYKIIAVKSSHGTRETVAAFVDHHNAYAGINGGYFHIGDKNDGKPAGALKIQSQWIKGTKIPRAALGWNENSDIVLIDRITTDKNFEVFPRFDKSEFSKASWQKVEHVIGGVGLLIKNGQIVRNQAPERAIPSFVEERHARTAVCQKKNKHWVFVVVPHTKEADREHVDIIAEGATLAELSDFMINLGCTDAINLDGGGSSTLVIKNKVMNEPAGDRVEMTGFYLERPVSDAILILPRV